MDGQSKPTSFNDKLVTQITHNMQKQLSTKNGRKGNKMLKRNAVKQTPRKMHHYECVMVI